LSKMRDLAAKKPVQQALTLDPNPNSNPNITLDPNPRP